MKDKIYGLIEEKMLTYSDLAEIPVIGIDEPLVPIIESKNLSVNQIDPNMLAITGEDIYVRQSVAKSLGRASLKLADYDNNLKLNVVYGYRSPAIQRTLFEKYKKQLSSSYEGKILVEATHRLIAEPSIAGHPTGGAVDIQITSSDKPLEFGTGIWQFCEDSYTYSPYISKEAWLNRGLLRRLMITEGFAPFDGEWWHYSYGDREWAYQYNEQNALYDQIDLIKK